MVSSKLPPASHICRGLFKQVKQMDEIALRALELAVQGRDAAETPEETVRRAEAFKVFLRGEALRITAPTVGPINFVVTSKVMASKE